MTYEQFLVWASEGPPAEWVNGEVIIPMPVKNEHQRILGLLQTLLHTFCELFDLGIVRVAPMQVKLSAEGSGREPDVWFLKQENLSRLTDDFLFGPPDLVIEILSTDSVRRDRVEKFKEYAEAGVPEYWIIDGRADRRRADFYRLDEAGHYTLVGTEDDERIESPSLPGFGLNPAWMWASPEPHAIRLLASMSPAVAKALVAEVRSAAAPG